MLACCFLAAVLESCLLLMSQAFFAAFFLLQLVAAMSEDILRFDASRVAVYRGHKGEPSTRRARTTEDDDALLALYFVREKTAPTRDGPKTPNDPQSPATFDASWRG